MIPPRITVTEEDGNIWEYFPDDQWPEDTTNLTEMTAAAGAEPEEVALTAQDTPLGVATDVLDESVKMGVALHAQCVEKVGEALKTQSNPVGVATEGLDESVEVGVALHAQSEKVGEAQLAQDVKKVGEALKSQGIPAGVATDVLDESAVVGGALLTQNVGREEESLLAHNGGGEEEALISQIVPAGVAKVNRILCGSENQPKSVNVGALTTQVTVGMGEALVAHVVGEVGEALLAQNVEKVCNAVGVLGSDDLPVGVTTGAPELGVAQEKPDPGVTVGVAKGAQGVTVTRSRGGVKLSTKKRRKQLTKKDPKKMGVAQLAQQFENQGMDPKSDEKKPKNQNPLTAILNLNLLPIQHQF